MDYLLLLAVLPGVLIAFYVYSKDAIEKEPGKLLFKLFLGGVICIAPAILLELLGSYLLYGDFWASADEYTSNLVIFVENFLVIALAEEACKFFVLKKTTWRHEAFNYRFDGIVYSVFAGMGFAVLENVLYVFDYGIGNAISRALTSIPGHAAFAVCMGIFYAEAKACENRGEKGKATKNLVLALILPIFMHGFFDFCLSANEWYWFLLFYVYIIVVDIVMIKKIKSFSKKDEMIIFH